MDNSTEWKVYAVMAGFWIIVLTVAVVPVDIWKSLSGGLV